MCRKMISGTRLEEGDVRSVAARLWPASAKGKGQPSCDFWKWGISISQQADLCPPITQSLDPLQEGAINWNALLLSVGKGRKYGDMNITSYFHHWDEKSRQQYIPVCGS